LNSTQSARPPAFLTVAEVADTMRVSGMTVYRLIHSGELRAVRVGRSFRVPAEALDEYLASAGAVEEFGQVVARGA
jgi:excisionase family DNA binding protein